VANAFGGDEDDEDDASSLGGTGKINIPVTPVAASSNAIPSHADSPEEANAGSRINLAKLRQAATDSDSDSDKESQEEQRRRAEKQQSEGHCRLTRCAGFTCSLILLISPCNQAGVQDLLQARALQAR